ncbi:MAG: galactose ABC transporter substrate-binding protein [Butyrivibrio sp.]|nr:galactose ABC transporter substrate-binding protein [Butyrivibrio sp.]
MKLKRTIIVVLVLSLMSALFSGCNFSKDDTVTQIKIGVTLYDQYDTYLGQLMNSFNEFVTESRKNGNDIIVSVYDASNSQTKQNDQVKEMIEAGCQVICVNLVDRTDPSIIIDMARKAEVPIIFFNRELVESDLMQWEKLYYVGADAFESGIMQGELAAEAISRDKRIDKNGDGIIQYLVIEGEAGHQDAILRTEYAVDTLIGAGIKVDKEGSAIANWSREQAQAKVAQYINEGGEDLEVIFANNDDMALGAIDAYKKANIEMAKRPVIYGIDGTQEGLQALLSGSMAGTVYNDKEGQAKALYELAYDLATHTDISDVGLTDDKYIRLPYTKVTIENVYDYLK